jgi:PAS domain-containing protein
MIEWLNETSTAAKNITILCSFFSVLAVLVWRNYIKVKKILYQVTNNGGKSMKDSIDKMEGSIDKILVNQTINVKRTQLLWEHNNQGYYECDADTGACTYANEILCDLFGLPLADFLGFGWLGVIETQSERNRIYQSWLAAVRDNIPYSEEYYITVGGQRKKVRTRAWTCREDETNKVLKMFGTLEEVKE